MLKNWQVLGCGLPVNYVVVVQVFNCQHGFSYVEPCMISQQPRFAARISMFLQFVKQIAAESEVEAHAQLIGRRVDERVVKPDEERVVEALQDLHFHSSPINLSTTRERLECGLLYADCSSRRMWVVVVCGLYVIGMLPVSA